MATINADALATGAEDEVAPFMAYAPSRLDLQRPCHM